MLCNVLLSKALKSEYFFINSWDFNLVFNSYIAVTITRNIFSFTLVAVLQSVCWRVDINFLCFQVCNEGCGNELHS